MTPEQAAYAFEGQMLGYVLGCLAFAGVVIAWVVGEWVVSRDERQERAARRAAQEERNASTRNVVTASPVLAPPLRMAEDGPRAQPRHGHRVPAVLRRGAEGPLGRAEAPARLLRYPRPTQGADQSVAASAPSRLNGDGR